MDPNEKDNQIKKAAVSKRATKPGAVAVAADEAARLDQRIAEKRGEGKPTTIPPQLTQLESDMEAKQRARGPTLAPGAHSVGPDSKLEREIGAKVRAATNQGGATSDRAAAKIAAASGGPTQLRSLEEDVAAKVRSAKPATTPGAQAVTMSSTEDAVAAKVRRETSTGVASDLRNLEDAVAAKVRRETSTTTVPGARAELANLEDSVAAKVRREASSAPGARTELANLEDAVSAKVRRETSGVPSGMSDLEDAVSAKVRRETSSSARNDLSSLEDSVAAKVRRETSSEPRSALGELEDAVSSKVRRETSTARGDLSNLESSISQKAQGGQTDMGLLERDVQGKENANMTVNKNMMDAGNGADGLDKKYEMPEQAPVVKQLEVAEQAPRPMVTTVDRGVAQPPDVEYGVYGLTGQDGLAVAIPVEEEEEDVFIQPAIEYDPDAKPPMYKNRRFRLYAFLGFFIVVVVAIGAAVGVTVTKKNAAAFAPTPAPTSFRESLGIRAQVERVVGSELLDDPDSPYSKALDWITFDDPLQLTPEASNFIQRYTCAYFYFATTVDRPWRSCNPPEDPWNDDPFCWFKLLEGIFPMTFRDIPWVSWLSNSTECDWAGVECDEQEQIRTIDVMGQDLTGTFPEGIYNWPFLQSLQMSWNSFHGPLPAEVVDMKHLVSIELHYNMFSGTIPDEWWHARNLQRINVGENLITGTISKGIEDLRDMKGLYLFTNVMTGAIPDELGSLDSMSYCRISRNELNGTIPETLGNLVNVKEIWAHRNQLTGGLPTTLGTMSLLDELRLHGNGGLAGTIPVEFYNIPRMERIDFYGNNFTGTISPAIGNWAKTLSFLRISDNKFYGQLPATFANLTELYTVWLSGNAFTGSFPESLCLERGDEVKEVLYELSADCAADPSGFVEFECACCTTCCQPNGTECLPTEYAP